MKCDKHFRLPEKNHVSPSWTLSVGRYCRQAISHWKVIVLTDRGLYAKWLFQAITKLGWHPLIRINLTGKLRTEGWHHWRNAAPPPPLARGGEIKAGAYSLFPNVLTVLFQQLIELNLGNSPAPALLETNFLTFHQVWIKSPEACPLDG